MSTPVQVTAHFPGATGGQVIFNTNVPLADVGNGDLLEQPVVGLISQQGQLGDGQGGNVFLFANDDPDIQPANSYWRGRVQISGDQRTAEFAFVLFAADAGSPVPLAERIGQISLSPLYAYALQSVVGAHVALSVAAGAHNGLVLPDRSDGHTYGIYTDGGVLHTEIVT